MRCTIHAHTNFHNCDVLFRSHVLLLGLFPLSGVAGMVFHFVLSCTSSSFNLTFSIYRYLFYTSLSTWYSVFLFVSFLVLVHLTFFLAHALPPSLHVRTTYPFLCDVLLLLILSHSSFLILSFFVTPHIHAASSSYSHLSFLRWWNMTIWMYLVYLMKCKKSVSWHLVIDHIPSSSSSPR